MSRRRDYEKATKIENRVNLQEKILKRFLLKIEEWTLMNLKNYFLNKSNAKESAVEDDAIWNFFDSITSFRIQSSEKFKKFLSTEIQETFDKILKNKRISSEMSVICALLKHSTEILFKSNKKSLDIIVVVKQTLRKRNASQNTRSVERMMH